MTITGTTLLSPQKDQFTLPADVHYLNCATRAPSSRAVEQAGHEAIRRQANPFGLQPGDFFSGAVRAGAGVVLRIYQQPERRTAERRTARPGAHCRDSVRRVWHGGCGAQLIP